MVAMDRFTLSEKEKEAVRALFNITNEEVQRKVTLLKEWIDSTSDLPSESKDDDFINIMLLKAKFKDEYVKTNIVNYYRTLKRYPEIFTNLGKFKPSEEVAVAISVPNIEAPFERVNILKLSPKILNSKSLDIDQLIQVIVTSGTIMFLKDYTASSRFILDFDGVTFSDLFRVNIRTLFKLVHITEEMLRTRISGIELYNAPRIIRPILGIARILLKPKMLSRVYIHKDLNSLHQNIPVSCIPSDYGGKAESTEDIIKLWDHVIETEQPFFEKIANLAGNNASLPK